MSGCSLDWCDSNLCSNDGEHWAHLPYVKASLVDDHNKDLKIGSGVVMLNRDEPAIYVHLDGGRRDVDEDAHMTADEAREVVANLTRCIEIAETLKQPALT
ncbi:hypothetical protein SEA_ECLIPTUS_21 [Gordonia phage Ecliptus]|nr:hypothetical protein SEA_ECLIPTUS_21 [Gordonia phage Ecliptus]